MHERRPSHSTLTAWTLLVPLLAACGGGGTTSGDGDDPTAPAGPYHSMSLAVDAAPPTVCAVRWGVRRLVPDEMLVHGSEEGDTSGDPLPLTSVIPHPYLIDAAGQMIWMPADGSVLQGAPSSDGDLIGMTTMSAGAVPGMTALLRESTAATDANLEGEYHLAALLYTGFQYGVWLGRATLDGAGGMQCWVSTRFGAEEAGPPGDDPLSFVYTVETNGRIDCAFATPDGSAGPCTGHGGVLPSGNLVVLAFGGGGGLGACPAIVLMLVRASDLEGAEPSAYTHLLDGSYRYVALRGTHGPSSSENLFAAETGSATADLGERLMWHDALVNEDGDIDTVPGDTQRKFSVDAQGHLRADSAAGLELEGGVSPSGRVAALAGGKSSFDPMELYLLFRLRSGTERRPAGR